MKLLFTIFLVLLFLTTYCRNEYPRIIVYEGDTLVLITMNQVDSLNITYATVDEYKEFNDSLKASIIEYELVIIKDKQIIKNLTDKNKACTGVVGEKDIIIEEHEKDNKKLKNKNKRLKFFNRILTATTTVLAVVVVIVVL